MYKEYRIKSIGSGPILGIIFCIFLPILNGYLMIKHHDFNWFFFLGVLFFCVFFPAVFFYYVRSIIIITDNEIILKRPDKTIKTPWNEIKKVDKTYAYFAGGFNYIVHTKRQGTYSVPDNYDNYEEIIKTIKEKTGLKIRWGL